jgi:carboxylesterase type B
MTINDFNGYLTSLVPNITSASQEAVRALYLDPASDGSIYDRTIALISDIIFTCNAQVIASSYAAHNNNAYRYIFAVPPASHGQDVPFTFYSSGDSPSDYLVTNTTVAFAIQRIVTSLSQFGIPQAESTPLEKYGDLILDRVNLVLCHRPNDESRFTPFSDISDPKNKRKRPIF